jgi:hypothetical protein
MMENDHQRAARNCLASLKECTNTLALIAGTLIQYSEINRALARDAAAAGCESLAAQKNMAAHIESEIAHRVGVILGTEELSPQEQVHAETLRKSMVQALMGRAPDPVHTPAAAPAVSANPQMSSETHHDVCLRVSYIYIYI